MIYLASKPNMTSLLEISRPDILELIIETKSELWFAFIWIK
jgi:hypothetical protein